MRKKLFAVIMSAMMMITFMPTMAFATENATPTASSTVTWNEDYTSATVATDKGELTVSASIAKDSSFTTNGQMKAELKSVGYNSSGVAYTINDWNSVVHAQNFYDFAGAKIVRYNSTAAAELDARVTADEFMNMYSQEYSWKSPTLKSTADVFDLFGGTGTAATTEGYIKFVDTHPAAGTTVPAEAYVDETKFTATDFEAVLPKYEKYQASQNYDVTITCKAETASSLPVLNADKMVSAYKVYIDSSSFTKVGLKIDGNKATETTAYDVTLAASLTAASYGTALSTTYTGSAQKLEVVTKGLTVQYSADNGKTWTETAPEIKDLTDTNKEVKFAIKATNDKNVSKYGKVKVEVKPAVGYIQFKKASFNFAPKTEVKPSDLVEFVAYETGTTTPPAATAVKVAMNAEDTALAKEAIDKCVKITGLDIENPENETVTVSVDTALLTAAVKADEKAYNFVKHFGTVAGTIECVTASTKVYFGVDYNDVTAVNKTVTYKAKNGKLAKAKTVTLKATADFGTCTFTKMNTKGGSKIKVAKSGKVTIKKGLKKGTYKVKVKVKAPGAKTNMFLTVKVK